MELVTILAFLILFLLAGIIYWYATIPENLPPGPPGLPFLGNALDYTGGNVTPVLSEHLKKYGPIFRLYMGDKLVVVLGDYESIHEALVGQGDVFSGRPQSFSFHSEDLKHLGIGMSEGQLWKDHRRFALSTLRDLGFGRPILEPRIKQELDYLADKIKEFAAVDQSFDPQAPLTFAVSNVVSQLIFGRRFSYGDKEFTAQFMALSVRVAGSGITALSPFLLSEKLGKIAGLLPRIRKFREEGEEFVRFTEKETKKTMATFDRDTEATNYIHAYMKIVDENKVDRASFSDKQLLTSVVDLFVAGMETTSTTLRHGLLYLATYPEIQERMVRELRERVGFDSPDYADRSKLPYCEAVVAETQRMADLVPLGVQRRNLTKTKLFGYDIPEDTVVIPVLTNVLHDEKTYKEADKFEPDRFLDENGKVIRDPKLIPFQIGKRICLGESLARMELFIFLTGLITRFRFYFPNDQSKPSLKPIVGITSCPQPYKICVEVRSE